MPKALSIGERLARCEDEIIIAEDLLKYEPPLEEHRKHGEWVLHTTTVIRCAIDEGTHARYRLNRATDEGVTDLAKFNEQATQLQKRIDAAWAKLQSRRIEKQRRMK